MGGVPHLGEQMLQRNLPVEPAQPMCPIESAPARRGAYRLRALGQKGDLELFIPLDPPSR